MKTRVIQRFMPLEEVAWLMQLHFQQVKVQEVIRYEYDNKVTGS